MLARKSFLIAINTVLGGLMGYLGIFLIVRMWRGTDGVWALGVINFGLAFAGLFMFLADMGYGRAHAKRMSEGMDCARCVGTFASIKLVLSFSAAAAVLVSVLAWKFVLGRGFESGVHESMIYIFIAFFLFTHLSRIPGATFVARREVAKEQVPILLQNVFKICGITAVVLLGLSVYHLASVYLASTVVLFAVSYLLFIGMPVQRPTREYVRSYSVFALPLFLTVVAANVIMNFDKVMIQLFWSSEQVGLYSGTQYFTTFIIALATGVSILLLPTISHMHSRRETGDAWKVIKSSERYISMVLLPVTAFVIVFAREFIHIVLSDDFLPAVNVLRMLVAFAFITSLSTVYSTTFASMDRVKLLVVVVTMNMLLNVSLNVILIPTSLMGIRLYGLGMEGAALATLFSFACTHVMYRFLAWTKLGIRPNPALLLHIGSVLITALAMTYIAGMVPITNWYHLLTHTVLFVGIYLGILFVAREFNREDLDLFLNTIHPGKMATYISTELKDRDYSNDLMYTTDDEDSCGPPSK